MLPRLSRSTLLVSVLGMALNPSVLLAADTNFYSLHEQWARQNKEARTGKEQALDDGFASAFQQRAQAVASDGLPVPITRHLTLDEILRLQSFVELEAGQTLIVQGLSGLLKFVSAQEGIVTIESIDTENLRVIASTIGSTFIHVWDARGRSTFSVKVLPPRPTVTASQILRQETLDKNRPFRFRYDNARAAGYTGDKFREMNRQSIDFNQNFAVSGDTPYGAVSSHLQTQKDRGKTLLSDAQVKLSDGKIGPLKNFDATAGDVRVESGLMVFPSARLRGGELKVWDDPGDTRWTTFYGRESTSQFGTVSSTLVNKRTLTSFLSGAVMDQRVGDRGKVKAGIFNGYGRSRADDLNRLGMGVQGEMAVGEYSTIQAETDFDDEKFAHRHSFTTQFEKVRIKNQFRDISKRFNTLMGAGSQQGEVGYLLDASAELNDDWSVSGSYDIFRDRLIPNPEDPGRYNQRTDFLLNYYPFNDMSFAFTYQDQDDTGRLSPARYRNMGAQMNTWLDAWGRRLTFFSRYNHRANHFLTSSFRDFRQDQLTVGFYTTLFWGINFSAQREWSYLEDVELGQQSHPNALTLTWDASRQLGLTPFYLDARIRLRDEEETESLNSFMAGEDSAELSGGLTFRDREDLELFITGSLTQYVPENLSVTEPRVEAQFFTGMKSNFDTGFRWMTTGSFDGVVFKDLNGDGKRDEGEPGLAGLRVLSSDDKEAVTDGDGKYSIENVGGKKATLLLDDTTIPAGYVLTGQARRDLAIIQGQRQAVDFGLTIRSDITGIVFNDLNANAIFDKGEYPVGGVTLLLENGRRSVTGPSGVYSFSGVTAGAHQVTLVVAQLPDGYLPRTVPKMAVELTEGMRYELHFPLKSQRTVTGRVYYDENTNGMMDAGETGLSMITVRLNTESVDTDKDGWYLFDDLKPGTYELIIDDTDLPAGLEAPPPLKLELTHQPIVLADKYLPLKKRPRLPGAEL